MSQQSFHTSYKVAAVLLTTLTLTACATPTVTTQVQISSRLSMSPTLDNPNLRPMPDWGHTVAIVPGASTKAMDPTYEAIKESVKAMLFAAKFEPIEGNKRSDYKLSIDWSLKPSRKIEEIEEVPVMMPGPIIWNPRYHHYHRMGMETVWMSQVRHVQLYMRTLTLNLYEGKDKTPVYTATVSHESRCKQYRDAIPYLVHAGINNLYSPNGTQKLETVEAVTEICR